VCTKRMSKSIYLVCSCDTPCSTARSCNIARIKSGKVSNVLSGDKGNNIIHNGATVQLALENVVRNIYDVDLSPPGVVPKV
jgi:hypothetical protein